MQTDKGFTRVQWVSDAAERVWKPRLDAITRAWHQVEIDSVREGLRPAALIFDQPYIDWKGCGRDAVSPGRYVVVKNTDAVLAGEFLKAWDRRDDLAIGHMLGFPDCCMHFFQHVWNEKRLIDTTLSMGVSSHNTAANILGRWVGVRFIPHLPCDFSCKETIAFAERLSQLWPKDEWSWAQEILNWPVEYSALHGIARITFPMFRVTVNTDYTPSEEVRRLQGNVFPIGSPRGLVFPFNKQGSGKLNAPDNSWVWKENGFTSAEGQRAAHDMLITALRQSPPKGRVLDLGCGNGLLLRKIKSAFGVETLGIDCEPKMKDEGFIHMDLKNLWGLKLGVDTVIASENRFREFPTLWGWIKSHTNARQVLMYSYDENRYAQVIQLDEVHADGSEN